MYEYIKGTIIEVNPSYVVLENQGIGYQILFSNPYRYSAKIGQEIKIYLHQVIREDAHFLYGFNRLEEKQLFLRLISVTGIGPKSGLAILANEDHEGLIAAIENSDVTYLTKFPGVGKKTAQQLIIDLQGKLTELSGQLTGVIPLSLISNESQALNEAMEALKALGYREKEIKKIEKELSKEAYTTTDEYLRAALRLVIKK